MNWLQFSLATTKDQVDAWSEFLLDSGAAAISLEDNQHQGIYELNPDHKPMWDKLKIIALFTEDIDPLLVQAQLANYIDAEALAAGHWKKIVEEDWLDKWKEDLQPMHFGNNLWICPSWCEIPDPTAINIILDPEQAFGTGTHPTTALCLGWIARNINSGDVVVDYGCGSGILAIAAAKMGASKTYGTDIDPLCLEVSNNNALKNHVSADDFITCLPEQMPAIKADLMIANILAQPLVGLAPTLAALLKPEGKLVLSGILAEQTDMVIQGYRPWFDDFEVQQQAEWVRITARKM